MNILIAGGTGFLGTELEKYFETKNYSISILTRKPTKENHIHWDGKSLGDWTQVIANTDILINLSGKSVDCRYTKSNKNKILNSRLDSTSILNKAVDSSDTKPKLWINSSSATIYRHSEDKLMTESNGEIGNDFSMSICKKWEKEFFSTIIPDVRKVAARTSIVLGNQGGAFTKMKAITLLGLGGKQGSGNQKMSWIHTYDFCRAIDFIIQNESISEAVNITAPNPVVNKVFMKKLRNGLKIPFGINQPKLLLEIGSFLIRTETELLLKSRNVSPEVLKNNDFDFKYPNVNAAFNELLSK